MIFDADLAQARARQREMASALDRLRDARTRLTGIRADYVEYVSTFEQRLVQARAAGYLTVQVASEPGAWEWGVGVDDHRRLDEIRRAWARAIRHLTRALEKLSRKIKVLEDRKFLLDYWLLEKAENWLKVDPTKLKEQIRAIVLAGEELSQFILGRKVELAFDTSQGAPLGHVPIHKTYRTDRKVYLSTILLEHQPPHLLDYYRALIVHELGHLLLHLRDSDYRRLCRLMRRHITLAPGFFEVFNILLDQQLERVLRDTRPEWQAWFNRLDFYTRQIPLRDLRVFLTRAGKEDADAAIADLASRRLIKVYDDPNRPFAAIQSGEIFSEGLPFSRLYAFYAVFANKLPLASLREPWLRECLELIPKDYKKLTVFEVHALAVEIYKILFAGPHLAFVRVEFERASDGTPVWLTIPGEWPEERAQVKVVKETRRKKDSRKGYLAQDDPPPQQTLTPPANPEGDPLPPQPVPPQPEPPRVESVPLKPGKRRSGIHPSTTAPRLLRQANRKPKQSWKVPKVGLVRKNPRAGLTPKSPKRSKRKPRTSTPPRPTPPRKTTKVPQRKSEPPRQPPPEQRPLTPRGPDKADFADQLAAERLPSWSGEDNLSGLTGALDTLLAEVRAELAGQRPQVVPLDQIFPEGGQSSDQRNETDVREFPPAGQIVRLLPDRRSTTLLARSMRPLVTLLRPYLAVIDPEKVQQERLTGGRRLLSSGLTKHLAYGETRLFADLRLTEVDQHRDVLVCVLIDTSASMQTDGRLARAQQVATLLAGCLEECPGVESVFLGYNQNIFQCGSHESHALTSLAPAGKTNEAAALDYLRKHHLDTPRRRKVVIVLTDGLPTYCSVESVRWLVRALEKEQGARFLYAALADVEHPAYRRRVDLTADLDPGRVRGLGRALTALLG
jgi:hypothetical protein